MMPLMPKSAKRRPWQLRHRFPFSTEWGSPWRRRLRSQAEIRGAYRSRRSGSERYPPRAQYDCEPCDQQVTSAASLSVPDTELALDRKVT